MMSEKSYVSPQPSAAPPQQPFLFAIQAPNGSAHIDESCVAVTAEALFAEVNGLNDSPDSGYTVVPVFLSAPAPATPAASVDMDENDVIVDRRDLFDFIRSAWRDGQDHSGDMDEAERWHKATDHANKAITGWRTLREAAPQQHAQAAWIDASVTKPEEGDLVLICGLIPADVKSARGLKGWRTCASFSDGDFFDANGCTMNSATHWMPLPNSAHDAASHQPAAAPAQPVADAEWPAGEREAWRLGRAAGIEEAAKVCDDVSGNATTGDQLADAIRVLIASAQPEAKP